ncbi:DUF5667 domain-containing protein [Streptomyces sp. NPDC048172]|uniref:DUF5667 domain-containing protein n=1 Tax=Streptomyces sp. NPDC048172 TaxID=3365505 RepID=UPI00371B68A0
MIGSVSTSRRAIAFAQALEEQELDEGAAAEDEAAGSGEHDALLTLAEGLEALPRPELDPEVKTVQRAQLIAAMETAFAEGADGADGRSGADGAQFPGQRGARAGARAPSRGAHRAPGLGPLSKLRPKSRLAKGLTAGGLGVGVAASAFGGMAAASTDALPGDTLYGLKRGMEDLQLDLAGDDADKGSVFLDHASTRLQEARRLMERDRAGELDHEVLSEVRRTLGGMRHDAAEGHRLLRSAYEKDGDIGRMQSLSSFSKGHRATWTQLRDRLPVQLTDVGDEVSSVFDAMDSEVTPLEALFPSTPDEGKPQRHERRDTRERTSEEAPSPTESSPSSPAGGGGGSESGSGSPSPSDSQREHEGLIGGGELLDPPKDEPEKERQPSDSGSGDSSPSDGGEPDVTLPPVVPDVLPGLGLDEGDK